MMPGISANPPKATASAAVRPVMTASVPTAGARAARTGTTPGWARASPGSATIGASVPSKSMPIRACRGSRSSASRPTWPAGVAGKAGPAGVAGGGMLGSAGFPVAGLCVTGFASLSLPWRADALAASTLRAQALDQHRVERQGFWAVEKLVQQLVVPGRGEAEDFADRLFLDTWGPPAAPLERENSHIEFGQRGHAHQRTWLTPPARGCTVRGWPVRGWPVRGWPVRGRPVRGGTRDVRSPFVTQFRF